MMTKPISPRTKKPFNARNLSSSSMMGYMFIFPAVFALTALVVYPICYGVYISFFKTNLANKWSFVGLKNYISLFKTSEFTGDLLLTLKFALIVVFFHFLIGGILALFLNQKRKGITVFRAILMLPWLFPDVVVALLFKWIMNPLYGILNDFLFRLGWIDTTISWLGSMKYSFAAVCFVAIWKGFPFVMINILAGLQSISHELYEAAEIDGANRAQSLFYITIPSLKPVLLTTIVLDTVWWFKHYTTVWLLTQGGPGNRTSVISISVYKEAFNYFNFGKAAAMSVIIFSVCFVISFVYRRVFDND